MRPETTDAGARERGHEHEHEKTKYQVFVFPLASRLTRFERIKMIIAFTWYAHCQCPMHSHVSGVWTATNEWMRHLHTANSQSLILCATNCLSFDQRKQHNQRTLAMNLCYSAIATISLNVDSPSSLPNIQNFVDCVGLYSNNSIGSTLAAHRHVERSDDRQFRILLSNNEVHLSLTRFQFCVNRWNTCSPNWPIYNRIYGIPKSFCATPPPHKKQKHKINRNNSWMSQSRPLFLLIFAFNFRLEIFWAIQRMTLEHMFHMHLWYAAHAHSFDFWRWRSVWSLDMQRNVCLYAME